MNKLKGRLLPAGFKLFVVSMTFAIVSLATFGVVTTRPILEGGPFIFGITALPIGWLVFPVGLAFFLDIVLLSSPQTFIIRNLGGPGSVGIAAMLLGWLAYIVISLLVVLIPNKRASILFYIVFVVMLIMNFAGCTLMM